MKSTGELVRMNKLIHSGLTAPCVSLSLKHLWVMPPQSWTAGVQAALPAIQEGRPGTWKYATELWDCFPDCFV